MPKSPRITHLSWGQVNVEGKETPYKDAKLFPGGSREWDWNETGTSHEPGIQPADVEELLQNGANIVILTKGINDRLQTDSQTIEMLKKKGVKYHILQTEEAVRKYNQLCEKELVGGLFHSTC